MYRVRHQIQANDKWPVRDKNLVVAVLDSGISLHPDLMDVVIEFSDFVNERKMVYDDLGHGTHICGIISGNGFLSNRRYEGIAPGTKLIVGKVLDMKGEGSAVNMLRALKWVEKLCDIYPIRVLNISIAINDWKNINLIKLIKDKLDALWDKGIIPVVSVGNGGPSEGSISGLARGEKCISVSCHDGDFYRNYSKRCELYSGRGSLKEEDGKKILPTIVAPGTEIISCNIYDQGKRAGNSAYCSKSGTSMATAIVSGAVIRLLQLYPELNNSEVKDKLIKTAIDLGEPMEKQGYGMVNIRKLLT